ncbi:MAG: IPTL-CTERM sorting domain-containing protein [Planctomycetota bacterium]
MILERMSRTRLAVAAVAVAIGWSAPVRAQCNPEEIAKFITSDPAQDDLMGVTVDVYDDTAVVGAYQDDHEGGSNAGSAYVFVRSGGVWTLQAELIPSDAAPGDLFGKGVAIQGDTVAIGATGNDHAGGTDAGAVYVFVRSGTVWTQDSKLTASDALAGDYFGEGIAIDGDTLIIGSEHDEPGGATDAGAVYVFVRFGDVWTEQAKLTASDPDAGDSFGHSVAISGDTALIDAYRDDHAGGVDAGAAYVFVRSGGVWSQQAKLIAPDAAAGDRFGHSVAISGDLAIIGAYRDDNAAGIDAGAAHVFTRSGQTWTQAAKLVSSDAAPGDGFGFWIALHVDTALISARFDDHSGGEDAGAVYVFARSADVWTEQGKLTASDGAGGDEFGTFVALHDDDALIGAWHDDHSGAANAGSAYLFDLNCQATVPTLSDWGMVAMTLLVLTAGTLVYARRRQAQA